MSTLPSQMDRPSITRSSYDYPEVGYEYQAETGAGWRLFAAIMLGFAGLLGFIDGLVAITTSSFYVAGAQFVFSDLNTWGWIVLVVGAVTMLAALGVTLGSQWARWTGIVLAGLQATAQLLMIQAYPFWSLVVFAIDVLVIYALAVYGGKRTGLNA
jgi:phosphatidylserine synthase